MSCLNKNLWNNQMEDDSDSDDDYDPNKDPTAKEEEKADEEEQKLEELSHARKRRADEAFNEIQQEFLNDTKEKINSSINSLLQKSKKAKICKKGISKKAKKTKNILSGIFGESTASTIVGQNPLITYSNSSSSSETGSRSSNDAMKKMAFNAALNIKKKEKVIEVRKFAGKKITVKKTIGAGEGDLHRKEKPTEATGLEKVLADIKGPTGVSTVAKSNIDWENYKQEKGLNDDLKEAAKDGYLGKKEFLERCDVRNFEMERDQRLKNSIKK